MYMHWSEVIAEKIIEARPDKEEYVCAAGISPSGSVHIGNFRDVATALFVSRALAAKGKKVRLLFSWDDFDRFRKVPKNVAAVRDDMEQYIGFPYSDVPDPFGCCESYAAHFEKEFTDAIEKFGITLDYRHQSEMYRSGAYADSIIEALGKRGEIFDILESFRTQDSEEGARDKYYPVNIYCPQCKRDTTTITHLSDDRTCADYECTCGYHGSIDFRTDFNCKMPWKVDWPMRWRHEGVDFEPGGKDHASPGGSYDTSKVISRKIFGYEPPFFQGYEFIGIKGATGKMSSSSGLNLTPAFLLNLYQPEVILWLYAKTDPMKAFDFCFDDGILRQYSTFDRMLAQKGTDKQTENDRVVMEYAEIPGREVIPVPMSDLVQFGSIVNFDEELLEEIMRRTGRSYTRADFGERLDRARFWLEQCDPASMYRLRTNRNWVYYSRLTDAERREVASLFEKLGAFDGSLDDLQNLLYDIPKEFCEPEVLENAKALKNVQTTFFKNVYNLLLDRDRGPRLYLFLAAFDKERYINLLDFSAAITPDEVASAVQFGRDQLAAEIEAEKAAAEAETHASIEDFQKLGLAVNEVVKVEDIAGSKNCYKITCRGSKGKRVIVSSAKDRYTPQDLLKKKIIVVENLKPHEICGVESQGMLLAAKYGKAANYRIIFVDEDVPAGAQVF